MSWELELEPRQSDVAWFFASQSIRGDASRKSNDEN
jgi:hypothetical protein